MPMELMVEVSSRRVFANAHTYHVNSISVNSDCETYMSADDLRINLWHLGITDRSFSILGDARTHTHTHTRMHADITHTCTHKRAQARMQAHLGMHAFTQTQSRNRPCTYKENTHFITNSHYTASIYHDVIARLNAACRCINLNMIKHAHTQTHTLKHTHTQRNAQRQVGGGEYYSSGMEMWLNELFRTPH